jgi:signal peptidase I
MSKVKTEKSDSDRPAQKSRVAEIAITLESLIITFALVLAWRAFVMEAYRIPTGSMAKTLMGTHFRLRCPQCGYKYDYGFVPERYGLPQDTIPRYSVREVTSRCPSCGHYQPAGGVMPVANGDRILVLKCIYQFFEPRQWDIVVFKDPRDPATNLIKRLLGRPGETVEIIDGDVYIDGRISRKPLRVQNELWMPVYDNDYQPARPREGLFNGHSWQQPFKNVANSKWETDKGSDAQFRLASHTGEIHTLIYDSSIGNGFRATYAYNDVRGYDHMPYCSDLMVRFYAASGELDGIIGISLSKYQTCYKAWVDYSGEMVIAKISEGEETVLDSKTIEMWALGKPALVKFANVDHQLIFEFGSERLVYDLGRSADDAGLRKTDVEPQVKIFGSGQLALSHISIFRDVHYTARKFADSGDFGRAIEGNPLTLRKDEFFVLGDNSPNSEDGRWWVQVGRGNNNTFYRKGIVPRDYLVGKAMLVYWPGGFKPFAKFPIAVIPNVGRMRFIYGGSSKNQ